MTLALSDSRSHSSADRESQLQKEPANPIFSTQEEIVIQEVTLLPQSFLSAHKTLLQSGLPL